MNAASAERAAACPYCLSPVGERDVVTRCASCRAAYHAECWIENGGCGIYGCEKSAVVEPRAAHEVPASFWGQEHKPCPQCGQEILAAAIRCRHCGATFQSARPQGAEEFQHGSSIAESLPAAKKTVVRIFVFSVVPFLAPLGAIWGLLWWRGNRERLRALPSFYGALLRLGLIASLTLTVAMTLLTLTYLGVRHPGGD
jgi:hypothetical protein